MTKALAYSPELGSSAQPWTLELNTLSGIRLAGGVRSLALADDVPEAGAVVVVGATVVVVGATVVGGAVVGGAVDKPIPSAPRNVQPKGAVGLGDHTGGLLEAKRRAQQKIKQQQEQN